MLEIADELPEDPGLLRIGNATVHLLHDRLGQQLGPREVLKGHLLDLPLATIVGWVERGEDRRSTVLESLPPAATNRFLRVLGSPPLTCAMSELTAEADGQLAELDSPTGCRTKSFSTGS